MYRAVSTDASPNTGCQPRCNDCSDVEDFHCLEDGRIVYLKGDNCSHLVQQRLINDGECIARDYFESNWGGNETESSTYECVSEPDLEDTLTERTLRLFGYQHDPDEPCSAHSRGDAPGMVIDLPLVTGAQGCVEFGDETFNKFECDPPQVFNCGSDSGCSPENCVLMEGADPTQCGSAGDSDPVDIIGVCVGPVAVISGIVEAPEQDTSIDTQSPTSSTSISGYVLVLVLITLAVVSAIKRAKSQVAKLSLGDKCRDVGLMGKLAADHSLFGICLHFPGDSFSSTARLALLCLSSTVQMMTCIGVLLVNPDDVDTVNETAGAALGSFVLSFLIGSFLSTASGSEILRKKMIGRSVTDQHNPVNALTAVAGFIAFLCWAGSLAFVVWAEDHSWAKALDLNAVLSSWLFSLLLHFVLSEPFFVVVKYYVWRESFVVLPLGVMARSRVGPADSDDCSDSLEDKDRKELIQELRMLRKTQSRQLAATPQASNHTPTGSSGHSLVDDDLELGDVDSYDPYD